MASSACVQLPGAQPGIPFFNQFEGLERPFYNNDYNNNQQIQYPVASAASRPQRHFDSSRLYGQTYNSADTFAAPAAHVFLHMYPGAQPTSNMTWNQQSQFQSRPQPHRLQHLLPYTTGYDSLHGRLPTPQWSTDDGPYPPFQLQEAGTDHAHFLNQTARLSVRHLGFGREFEQSANRRESDSEIYRNCLTDVSQHHY